MHDTPLQPSRNGGKKETELLQTLRILRYAAMPAPAPDDAAGASPAAEAEPPVPNTFARLAKGGRPSAEGATPADARDRAPEARGDPAPRAKRRATVAARWTDPLRGWRPSALLLSFLLVVAAPFALAAVYLLAAATPQYASTTAFTVRSGPDGGIDALSGIARFTGAPGEAEAAILAEFLQSQTLVERLDRRLDIVRHYSGPSGDPVFALAGSATVEDLLSHWRRKLRVTHDAATGLVELRVLAFSPEMAQLLARELLVEGQTLVNDLNARARQDAVAEAEGALALAEARLIAARAAIAEFRGENGIADAGADLDGRLGVVRLLQGQLAQALVEDDAETDADRIAALRSRIDEERARLAAGPDRVDGSYPALLAAHERLAAERDFAETAWRSALAAHEATMAAAARQATYLAVHVQPTLAERAEFPRSGAILGLLALFLVLAWSIALLTRAAIRDRR
jgi:capsular polysaccharide transport system permease protein